MSLFGERQSSEERRFERQLKYQYLVLVPLGSQIGTSSPPGTSVVYSMILGCGKTLCDTNMTA